MAKQVSRYQHLSAISEGKEARLQELERESKDKDDYILKTEREHAAIYRERETAECQIASLKTQLQDATSLFETAREARRHDQEDFDQQALSFKTHIAKLNARLNLLPPGEAELRALVTDANERAGIAEEEYRKKSAELKAALKEVNALKTKVASTGNSKANPTAPRVTEPTSKPSATSVGRPAKAVRWSFDPSEDSSQPFWDHSNEYSLFFFFFFF